MLNQKVFIFTLMTMLSINVYAATGSSVPVIEDNSDAIKEHSKNIDNYLKQIAEFLGASDKNNISGSGDADFGQDANGNKQGFGKVVTTGKEAVEDTLGSSFSESAATKYYGNAVSNGCKGQPDSRNFQACNAARNMVAKKLEEVFTIMTVLEKRNTQLQSYMQNSYSNSGDLQKKQYQMSVMQALIQNDLVRLQGSLAAYETKVEIYKQIEKETANQVLYGDKEGYAKGADTNASGGGGFFPADGVSDLAVGMTTGVGAANLVEVSGESLQTVFATFISTIKQTITSMLLHS